MSKHICQGPKCHTYDTQSRIRGVKGSKVLRTRNARYDNVHTEKNIRVVKELGIFLLR
jgi:hypothetical protein